jgi:hypothetical protein
VPSAVLLAEAVWVAVMWRVWVVPDTEHIVELGVVVLIVVIAVTLPLLMLRDTGRLTVAYLSVLALGVAGFGALASLQWIILQR